MKYKNEIEEYIKLIKEKHKFINDYFHKVGDDGVFGSKEYEIKLPLFSVNSLKLINDVNFRIFASIVLTREDIKIIGVTDIKSESIYDILSELESNFDLTESSFNLPRIIAVIDQFILSKVFEETLYLPEANLAEVNIHSVLISGLIRQLEDIVISVKDISIYTFSINKGNIFGKSLSVNWITSKTGKQCTSFLNSVCYSKRWRRLEFYTTYINEKRSKSYITLYDYNIQNLRSLLYDLLIILNDPNLSKVNLGDSMIITLNDGL